MPKKRIILLLDGTWNDADSGPSDTNIVRLRQIISKSLSSRISASVDQSTGTSREVTSDVTTNLVFYLRGVGTGPFDQLSGGAFGIGVSENIRQAYRLLSFHYEPDDEVFVFGFSRGAHTARSLVGYIASLGLLKREHCTPEGEWKSWGYYRTPPNERFPGIWHEFTPLVHCRTKLRIRCLGVFETVGALGIPLPLLWRANRERYQFHDVDLSSITDINLHALAIDEHRQPFQATTWRKPRFEAFNSVTEQVWFPGAHSDVGGGYSSERERDGAFAQSLDDLSLDWMLKRLKFLTNGSFPASLDVWRKSDKVIGSEWALKSPQHESRNRQFRFWRYALRSIGNTRVEVGKHTFRCNVGYDRHSDTVGEMIHISAIERLGRSVHVDGTEQRYQPDNLVSVLPRIYRTYRSKDELDPRNLKVVQWNGDEYRFESSDGLLSLLKERCTELGVELPNG